MHTGHVRLAGGIVSVVVAIALCAPGDPPAGEPQKEDRSGCKLPHGDVVVPDRNTPEGRTGFILRLSDGSLNPATILPGEKPRSNMEYLQALAAVKAGDFIYSPHNGGSLCAVSARATDLGGKFLYEFSGTSFDRPPLVYSKKERSGAGEATPGVIDGIQDGHCYLIETHDGKSGLVRIVQKRGPRVLVQYVYQPDGSTRQFEIPKGLTPADSPAGPTPTTSPASRPATRPARGTTVTSSG